MWELSNNITYVIGLSIVSDSCTCQKCLVLLYIYIIGVYIKTNISYHNTENKAWSNHYLMFSPTAKKLFTCFQITTRTEFWAYSHYSNNSMLELLGQVGNNNFHFQSWGFLTLVIYQIIYFYWVSLCKIISWTSFSSKRVFLANSV